MNEKKIKVYELKEVCKELNIGLQVLRSYIKEGKIKASKIGRKYVITEESINDFINSNLVKTTLTLEDYLKDNNRRQENFLLSYLFSINELTKENPINFKDWDIETTFKHYVEQETGKKHDLEEVRSLLKETLTKLLDYTITIERKDEDTTLKGSFTLISKVVDQEEEGLVVELNKNFLLYKEALQEKNIIKQPLENFKNLGTKDLEKAKDFLGAKTININSKKDIENLEEIEKELQER